MPAGKYNFTCEQGATFDRSISYSYEDGSRADLTGYIARMHVREYSDGPLIIAFESTSSNGQAIVNGSVETGGDGANGNIRLLVSAVNSSAIPSGSYKYDLELESPQGVVVRLIEGKFSVVSEITE